MGKEKHLIPYHGVPQWKYATQLFTRMGLTSLVSCRQDQAGSFGAVSPGIVVVPDHPAVAGHGPISGVLSAFRIRPWAGFLVLGCDYPWLSMDDLMPLKDRRSKQYDAICFHREAEKVDEPLAATYESSMAPLLEKLYFEKQFSLRLALKQVRTLRLSPAPSRLISVDYPG
jgi:molybdopterin-guanine dinucleotide biosynthesis protein A